jgi:hypothetical protein
VNFFGFMGHLFFRHLVSFKRGGGIFLEGASPGENENIIDREK